MKLYNSIGPNPRLVRMFMAEKGIDIDKTEVDLMGGENRRAPYTDKNPAGELPALAACWPRPLRSASTSRSCIPSPR